MLRTYTLLSLITVFSFWNNSAYTQGDDCGSAVSVTPGVHTSDGPATGFGWGGSSCAIESPDNAFNSDWYSYTPALNGLARVFQCSLVDSRVNIRTGACGSQICVGGNDDDNLGDGSGGCGHMCCGSSTDFPVTAGTAYFIEWDDRWSQVGFDWTLEFHNCTPPEVAFLRVNDCMNSQYSVEVDVTSLGSAATVDVVNDAGAPNYNGVGIGSYTVGPFALGTEITVTVAHDSDPFCDAVLGPVINYPCPTVSCGPDNHTYCYGDNDTTIFIFESSSNASLILAFNSSEISTIEDSLFVYDGDNSNAPLLYAGNNGGNLNGLTFVSSNAGDYLMMQVKSQGFISCQTGGINGEWDWDISCLDCTEPVAQYTVIPDCQHKEYSIEVDLTDLGGSATVDITNTGGAPDINGVGIGTHTVGPFGMNDPVQIGLEPDNLLCSAESAEMDHLFEDCTVISCGQDDYTYCYENSDDSWFVYKSDNTDVLRMTFSAGAIALGDEITVYNGLTDASPVYFTGNNGGDLSGLWFDSDNSDNALLLRFTSDANLSCDDGSFPTAAAWSIKCSAVGIEELWFDAVQIYPNPSNGTFNLLSDVSGQVSIQVKDVMGRTVLDKEASLIAGASYSIDLDFLKDGAYFIELELNGERGVKKLLIQR